MPAAPADDWFMLLESGEVDEQAARQATTDRAMERLSIEKAQSNLSATAK
jgi:hypothetical protein